MTDCLITHIRPTIIRFPIKWNTDDVFDQAAYYARRQGEFKDVMSKLEEMARLGAKVGTGTGMGTVLTCRFLKPICRVNTTRTTPQPSE